MKKFTFLLAILCFAGCNKHNNSSETAFKKIQDSPLTYKLASPDLTGKITLEKVLSKRRSHRSYLGLKITAEDISQILWAAYGITKLAPDEPYVNGGYRTTPSAGSVYPLKIYLLAANIKNIEKGVYEYSPVDQTITRKLKNDIKNELAVAALNQDMIADAPACLFISAIPKRMKQLYGDTIGMKYTFMESGHVAQNIYLEAEALHLGTCSVGGFKDEEVNRILNLSKDEIPLYIMPLGKYYPKE